LELINISIILQSRVELYFDRISSKCNS